MGDTYNNILIDNTNIDENIYKDTNITIINVNNINLVINDFENIDYVRIFGKGNTFQDVKKTSEKEFNIGINQTVNELTDCDMLAINDLHNIYLIKDEVFKKIKYILTPEYLHIKLKFNIEGHFQKVYDYIKEKGFVGKYIVYNLKSNPKPNRNYISLLSRISSCNTTTDFVCTFLNKFIRTISFFGVGIHSDNNYNDKFVGNGKYDIDQINRIKKNIDGNCKANKIKYILN
jgi:hypothetical protein